MTTNFEAKLHGFRRTQDGVVVSYVVHPADVSAELATAALGTRYMVAVAEIGDDERIKEALDAKEHGLRAGQVNDELPPPPTKDRRPFASLPLSQQCAMRCNEPAFQEFMDDFSNLEGAPDTAWAVRHYCGVDSRSKIVLGSAAGVLWDDLEKRYQRWTTDRQYADSRR